MTKNMLVQACELAFEICGEGYSSSPPVEELTMKELPDVLITALGDAELVTRTLRHNIEAIRFKGEQECEELRASREKVILERDEARLWADKRLEELKAANTAVALRDLDIKGYQELIAIQKAELDVFAQTTKAGNDTVDENGAPTSNGLVINTDVDPVVALCHRMGKKVKDDTDGKFYWEPLQFESALSQEAIVRQSADRFTVLFSYEFYQNNRDECYGWLGRLMRLAHKKSFASSFENGYLTIVARKNSYRHPEE